MAIAYRYGEVSKQPKTVLVKQHVFFQIVISPPPQKRGREKRKEAIVYMAHGDFSIIQQQQQ